MNVTKRDKCLRERCEQQRSLSILTYSVLAIVLSLPIVNAAGITKGQPVKIFAPLVKPGEYVWQPELSPAEPVVIVVNLPEQLLYVYRNGVRIGWTTISSGKVGHRTPTGIFTILQKSVEHTSTIYKGASMPYMERLTWGGIASMPAICPVTQQHMAVCGYRSISQSGFIPLQPTARRLLSATTKPLRIIPS
jgi:L,D-transpeptidase catalytic domain